MSATTTLTMTAAQMKWNLAMCFAWFEKDADGNPKDHWHLPIWTAAGVWLWDAASQCYEFLF